MRYALCLALALTVASVAWVPACATNSASIEYNGILHYIETDKYAYELPEYVSIQYTATNVSGAPIWLVWSYCCSPVWVYALDPDMQVWWSDPRACFAVECDDTLQPGEAYTRSAVWDMYNPTTGEMVSQEGVYTIRGRLKVQTPFRFEIDLPIEITERTTGAPEEGATWGRIKALYR